MSYVTISSQENHHFSLCSYFHAHPTTLLLKILGGPMHGPSPRLKFWGDRPPQSPPRSPPLMLSYPHHAGDVSCIHGTDQGGSSNNFYEVLAYTLAGITLFPLCCARVHKP